MIPSEDQVATQSDHLVGRTLRDGEYRVRCLLPTDKTHSADKIYLATHTTLSIPLLLKQILTDQPLPESIIAELNYILHGGDTTRRSADTNALDTAFPSSGGYQTDQFSHEALMLARLQHPALPTLFDYFAEDGYWYLVSNYIPGTTMRRHLQYNGSLPVLEALDYMLQLCDVLDYLHRQHPPVIFCALRPETIMILPDHSLMLTSFEEACYINEPIRINRNVDNTVTYAPPELRETDGEADMRSDIYSLGLILHEMLSGQIPDTLNEPDLPALPAFSKILNGIIKLATQEDVYERFQSAHILFLALERAYRIEERRVYQRSIYEDAEIDEKPYQQVDDLNQAEGDITEVIPYTLDLDQRRLARESLHHVRLERLEQEQFERQMASVDESLQRRSSISVSQLSLHSFDTHPSRDIKTFSLPSLHRLIQLSFASALIIFMVMASLLIYIPLLQPIAAQMRSSSLPTPPITVTTTTPYVGTWQKLPTIPGPQADNAAVYLKLHGREYVYMNGGYRGSTHPFYDYNLYRYDIAAARWEIIVRDKFPSMINNAATVDEQQTLFFTAGYASKSYGVHSLLYSYQPKKNQIKKIVPPEQISPGFASSLFADQQGHLYLTQGFMHAGNPNAHAGNGWYRYDIATNHWQRLADIPRGIGYGALTDDGHNNILMFGGAEDAGQKNPTATIYRYDIAHDSWSQDPVSMPQAISGASSCAISPHQLILIGGYDKTQNKGLDTAWLFDLHTLQSQQLSSLTAGGSVLGASACDKQGHAYVIRGANNPMIPTSDFWKLSVIPDTRN